MIKKIIGILILAAIFVGVFYAIADSCSLKAAIFVYGGTALSAGIIIGAVYLITDD